MIHGTDRRQDASNGFFGGCGRRVAVAAGWVAAFGAGAGLAATPVLPERPALVVVVAIDQFRGDYLDRFGAYFGAGGFRRLLEHGANFTDCRYRHGITKTAAGHAVMLTGVHANEHGIINNAWVERGTLKRVNCVEDATVAIVGRPETPGGVRLPGQTVPMGVSPRRLLATTVGDELKIATAGRAKVIGLANKDRSAVLLAGKLGDSAYWMDRGLMVTSTHYRVALPPWVAAFNAEGRIDRYFGQVWDRVLPAEIYDRVQGPDEAEGEAADYGLGLTFPRRVDGGAATLGTAFYNAFDQVPFKSEVLMAFAEATVTAENLGGRGVTDLLGLGLSVNDSVGHSYGPDSHEVMDVTLRTDRMLAEFFSFLDRRVGAGRWLAVLTADHGIAPLPERVKALGAGVNAGRVDNVRLLKTGEAALDAAFGRLAEGRRWFVIDENSLVLVPVALAERNVAAAEAERVLAAAIGSLEFVDTAWTRTDLLAGRVHGEWAAATRLSFHAERSGDVYFQVAPYWVDRKNGTNHGSPYRYDTHVPLLWMGPGVKPGRRPEPVGVEDLAPTLAHLLGIPAPPKAQGRVLF